MYIESVDALSSGHNPVILIVDLEPYESTLPWTDAFTGNFSNRRQQKTPNITSIEVINIAIAIIILTLKSARKKSPKLHHIDQLRDLAVSDLEEYREEREKQGKTYTILEDQLITGNSTS